MTRAFIGIVGMSLFVHAGCSGAEVDAPGAGEASGAGGATGAAANGGNAANGGSAPTCSAANCEGCCDPEGVCRLGLDDAQCGGDGEHCADCTSTGASCQAGACEVLTCALAASDPDEYPCNFCSPDGSAIIHCGFCHAIPADDQLEPCEQGSQCYMWDNPQYSADWPDQRCMTAPPELCDPEVFQSRCDGEVTANCEGDTLVNHDDCLQYPGHTCEVVISEWSGLPVAQCVPL